MLYSHEEENAHYGQNQHPIQMESGPSHTTENPLSFLTEIPSSSVATPGSLTLSTDGPLGIPHLVSHLRPAHSITCSSLKPQ